MAKYGVDLYGSALYGDPDPLIYSAAPFQADPLDYGSINLTWRKPGGTWTGLRLVRSYLGHPVESTDGDLLVDGDSGTLSFFLDNTVGQGLWVYYSLFVYIPADALWYRVDKVTVHSPISYDGGAKLYDRTPRVYKGAFSAAGGSADDNPALAAFLNLIGFQLDVLRNLTDSLLDLDNAHLMKYDLIDARLAEYGIPAESALSPLQYRRYLESAIWLYKNKGTVQCIQALVSIFMGCNSTVAIGSNLLWTADLSDFVGGVGEWVPTNPAFTTVTWKKGLPDDFGAATHNSMSVVNTGSATSAAVEFVDTTDPTALGIPVTVGIPVTAQAYVTGTTNNGDTAQLQLRWYNAAGVFLSVSSGGSTAVRNGLSSIASITANPPAGSAFASLRITFTPSVLNTEFLVSVVQVNLGNQILPHQYGRDVQILLEDSGLTANQVAVREARLRAALPRYLPLGATYTLVHNSPPPPPGVVTEDVVMYGS